MLGRRRSAVQPKSYGLTTTIFKIVQRGRKYIPLQGFTAAPQRVPPALSSPAARCGSAMPMRAVPPRRSRELLRRETPRLFLTISYDVLPFLPFLLTFVTGSQHPRYIRHWEQPPSIHSLLGATILDTFVTGSHHPPYIRQPRASIFDTFVTPSQHPPYGSQHPRYIRHWEPPPSIHSLLGATILDTFVTPNQHPYYFLLFLATLS